MGLFLKRTIFSVKVFMLGKRKYGKLLGHIEVRYPPISKNQLFLPCAVVKHATQYLQICDRPPERKSLMAVKFRYGNVPTDNEKTQCS